MRSFISSLAAGFMVSLTPAVADVQHFEHAFLNACFLSIPNLDTVMGEFSGDEWMKFAGADEGEYEFHASDTMVFLSLIGETAGCTVSDPALSIPDAEALLERALADFLENNQPSSWEKGTGYDNQPVWVLNISELYLGTAPINFYIDEGLGGGAAISFQLPQ